MVSALIYKIINNSFINENKPTVNNFIIIIIKNIPNVSAFWEFYEKFNDICIIFPFYFDIYKIFGINSKSLLIPENDVIIKL